MIHSDFERGFIKAETVAYDDLVACGSVAAAREKGLYRMEGKEYVVADGDVLLFKFNVLARGSGYSMKMRWISAAILRLRQRHHQQQASLDGGQVFAGDRASRGDSGVAAAAVPARGRWRAAIRPLPGRGSSSPRSPFFRVRS